MARSQKNIREDKEYATLFGTPGRWTKQAMLESNGGAWL
jgi:hypothetical protein